MRLNEIFSNDFIEKLNSLNDGSKLDSNQNVDGFIDVEKILNDLNFTIIKKRDMNGSGLIERNKIFIDESEIKSRQRFSMAHELGHAMKNNRHANRNDDSSNYDPKEKQGEVFANTFAAQFLMPEKLVLDVIDAVLAENGIDKKRINNSEMDIIVNETAEKLKVSRGAMKFRIKNLGIFIPAEKVTG